MRLKVSRFTWDLGKLNLCFKETCLTLEWLVIELEELTREVYD